MQKRKGLEGGHKRSRTQGEVDQEEDKALKTRRRLGGENKVSKAGRKTRHLEGHEEISKATRSPRREGGPEVETDVSQDNWRFSRREEDLEIKKDNLKVKKCIQYKEEISEQRRMSQLQGDIEGMEVSTAKGRCQQ